MPYIAIKYFEMLKNHYVIFQTGCTAVHLCCKAADLASLALLLKHGARTDVFDNVSITILVVLVVKTEKNIHDQIRDMTVD